MPVKRRSVTPAGTDRIPQRKRKQKTSVSRDARAAAVDPGPLSTPERVRKASAEAQDLLRAIIPLNLPYAADYVRRNPPSDDAIAMFGFYTYELLMNARNKYLSGKGGGREKINQDLQTAINWIAAEIKQAGGTPTVRAVVTWIKEETGDFGQYSFEPMIPNCDDLMIDGEKLVWKDRDGREQSIAFSSLRRYLHRSKD